MIEVGEGIRDKIVKTYIEYSKNFKEYPQIVILMKPKTFSKLRKELMEIVTTFTPVPHLEPYKVQLFGNEAPIIIKNTLPENVEFLIMLKEEYEKREREEKLTEWIGGLI